MTEASPMGLGLYLRFGFVQVGEFVITMPTEVKDGDKAMRLPVMKLVLTDE